MLLPFLGGEGVGTEQNPNFWLPDFCDIFGQVVQKFRHFLVVVMVVVVVVCVCVCVCVCVGGGGGDKVQAILWVIQFFIQTAI